MNPSISAIIPFASLIQDLNIQYPATEEELVAGIGHLDLLRFPNGDRLHPDLIGQILRAACNASMVTGRPFVTSLKAAIPLYFSGNPEPSNRPSGTVDPAQLVAALERMAKDCRCDIEIVCREFSRLAPDYLGKPDQLLRATSLAVRRALEKKLSPLDPNQTNHRNPISPESPVNHAASDTPDLLSEIAQRFESRGFSFRFPADPTATYLATKRAEHLDGSTAAAAVPATIKVEIELTEEEAAAWWDDVTWTGQAPRSIDSIVRDHVFQRIRGVMKNYWYKNAKTKAVASFRELHTR